MLRQIYHPNIDLEGAVCLNLVSHLDPIFAPEQPFTNQALADFSLLSVPAARPSSLLAGLSERTLICH